MEHAGDPGWPSAYRYGGEDGSFTSCLKVVLEPWPMWMVSVWCHYPGTDKTWLTDDWTPERLIVAILVAEAELTGVGREDAGLERVSPVEVLHTRALSDAELAHVQARWDRERGG